MKSCEKNNKNSLSYSNLITQKDIKDWAKGECEPIPGKTMYKIVPVERDYTKIYEKIL